MAGYNYAQFVSDFSGRTIDNQKKIDALREADKQQGLDENELNNKHYEATQLINSLFGLLIVPYEKYKFNPQNPNDADSMKEEDLKQSKEYYEIARLIVDLEKKGCLYNSYNDRYLVGQFIHHMRNSLAHSGNEGLQFLPISKAKSIKTVIFHDADPNNKNHQFCAELFLEEIRKLSQLLADMYKYLEHKKEVDDLPRYEKKYQKNKELMEKGKTQGWAVRFENEIQNHSRMKKD